MHVVPDEIFDHIEDLIRRILKNALICNSDDFLATIAACDYHLDSKPKRVDLLYSCILDKIFSLVMDFRQKQNAELSDKIKTDNNLDVTHKSQKLTPPQAFIVVATLSELLKFFFDCNSTNELFQFLQSHVSCQYTFSDQFNNWRNNYYQKDVMISKTLFDHLTKNSDTLSRLHHYVFSNLLPWIRISNAYSSHIYCDDIKDKFSKTIPMDSCRQNVVKLFISLSRLYAMSFSCYKSSKAVEDRLSEDLLDFISWCFSDDMSKSKIQEKNISKKNSSTPRSLNVENRPSFLLNRRMSKSENNRNDEIDSADQPNILGQTAYLPRNPVALTRRDNIPIKQHCTSKECVFNVLF